ncbi:MAG: efflux RND transporter periplasmic adaptor subunit [bacterium]|nr:efflux RND transporter periplasmic adaptor subunit [bacterium]
MKLRNIVLIAIAVVAIGGLVGRRLMSSNSVQPGSPSGQRGQGAPLNVSALIVEPQTLNTRISSTGSLLANEEVILRPETSGKIIKIYFQEGKVVEKGDLLVKINDDELQAGLDKAIHRKKQVDDRLKRNEALYKTQGVSQEDYEAAVTEANSLQAEVDLLKAQIAKTEIHAPFRGVVGLRNVSEGAYVTSETQIASFQDISRLKLDFSAPERYGPLLAVGTVVTFKLEGHPSDHKATIYAVEPRIDRNTRTIQIRALTEPSDKSILPGAFANVDIPLERVDNALMVPTQALIPDLKSYKLFVYEGGKAAVRVVQAGARTEQSVQILEGLHPGDTLITSGLLQIRPGASIQISNLQSASNE